MDIYSLVFNGVSIVVSVRDKDFLKWEHLQNGGLCSFLITSYVSGLINFMIQKNIEAGEGTAVYCCYNVCDNYNKSVSSTLHNTKSVTTFHSLIKKQLEDVTF